MNSYGPGGGRGGTDRDRDMGSYGPGGGRGGEGRSERDANWRRR